MNGNSKLVQSATVSADQATRQVIQFDYEAVGNAVLLKGKSITLCEVEVYGKPLVMNQSELII